MKGKSLSCSCLPATCPLLGGSRHQQTGVSFQSSFIFTHTHLYIQADAEICLNSDSSMLFILFCSWLVSLTNSSCGLSHTIKELSFSLDGYIIWKSFLSNMVRFVYQNCYSGSWGNQARKQRGQSGGRESRKETVTCTLRDDEACTGAVAGFHTIPILT